MVEKSDGQFALKVIRLVNLFAVEDNVAVLDKAQNLRCVSNVCEDDFDLVSVLLAYEF